MKLFSVALVAVFAVFSVDALRGGSNALPSVESAQDFVLEERDLEVVEPSAAPTVGAASPAFSPVAAGTDDETGGQGSRGCC